MGIINEVRDAKTIIDENKKSLWTLMIGLLLIIIICNLISIDYYIFSIRIDYIITALISLIYIVWWCYQKIYIKKNKTKLPGVGILIRAVEEEKNNAEKSLFLKALKNEFSGKLFINVYYEKELKKYLNKDDGINLAMKRLNLSIIFEVKESSGFNHNDNNYQFEIINNPHVASLSTDGIVYINDFIVRQISYDIKNCFNKTITISHSNSLNDTKKESLMLHLSSLYLLSIVEVISMNPQKALKTLDNISLLINTKHVSKREFDYINKNKEKWYLFAYIYIISKTISGNYYKNSEKVRLAKLYLNNMRQQLNNSKKYFTKNDYNYFNNGCILYDAIITYDSLGPLNSLDIINQLDFTSASGKGALINKAFLLVQCNRINEGVILYKKVLKTNSVPYVQIEDILTFISTRMDDNPNDQLLKLCYAIVNYYKKDKKLALKYFEELSNDRIIPDKINEIIF